MARLAIRGHETRGKEVIEILKMLGAKEKHLFSGTGTGYYYIDVDNNISYILECDLHPSIKPYSLADFFERFPYKIEDKVVYERSGKMEVVKMYWDGALDVVRYDLHGITENFAVTGLMAVHLKPYKEKTMESKPDLLQQLKEYFDNTPRDVLEKEWNELSYLNEIGPTVNEYLECVKKYRQSNQYPKTYEKCCELLMGKTDFQDFSLVLTKLSLRRNEENRISPEPPHINLINNFYKLIICRDAYWKVAGGQMGLGKSWEPDLENEELYCIQNYNNQIVKSKTNTAFNKILIFPTEEMRDIFFWNFKKEIEECKEFL